MTKEQRELLLKDLSSRLPYKIKVKVYNHWTDDFQDETITIENLYQLIEKLSIEDIKPYLFPLSSMTEEQKEELFIVVLDEQVSISDCSFNDMTGYSEILTNYIVDAIDWFNKNHFDYRDLIPKGLALDATNLNIY